MQTITAIFEDGVLKPAQPLDPSVQAEVRVTIELLRTSSLTVANLNTFLQGLPSLGDDAADFVNDVDAVRKELPVETNPWV